MSVRRSVRSLLLAVLGTMLMSCAPGSSSSPAEPAAPTTGAAASTTTTAPAAAPSSKLIISVTDASGSRAVWRLTCDPPGGDHPDPGAACQAMDTHADALRAVPKDRVCAEVYGGPEKAAIDGTWRGQQVRSTLARSNSCEIARWAALQGLLPPGGS